MKLIPPKTLTVRLPGSLMEAIEHEAEASGATVSDWVRAVLQSQLELDPGASRHEMMLYEIVKSRALTLQVLHTKMDVDQVNELVTLAEEMAAEYVRERLGKEAGDG